MFFGTRRMGISLHRRPRPSVANPRDPTVDRTASHQTWATPPHQDVMHRQLVFMFLFVADLAGADSKLDSAKNMCAEFAKSKPAAQQKAFAAECVESMVAAK